MQSTLTHPTYKFVSEQEADASAWIFTSKTEGMTKVHIKLPEIRPNELRIKITYTGLCHSDIHNVREDWRPCPYPIAPGHEVVGQVTHLGSGVTNFKVGDKVGFGCFRQVCGECKSCKNGSEQLCSSTTLEQKVTYGAKFWGGFASHLQQPAEWFYKLPENLPESKIPPLFCAGITTYAPIAKYAKAGDEVAVLGVGGLGHMAVQYAKAWGCKVTAFTSSSGKEEFIKGLGADRVVLTNPETFKQEAKRFDLVLNTLPTADDLDAYVLLTANEGTFVQLGAPPFGKKPTFNPALLIFSHVRFTGSLVGSRKETQDMLDFSAKHNIVPMCEEFDYEKFPEAFDRLENGRPIFRCVVDATHAH